MDEEIRAYAVKQDVVNYDAENLVMLQAQLVNRDYVGRVMVEKVSKDSQSYAAGKHYIPGVAMKFGEHPVEAGHRILTEELEVEDREIRYVSTQSHWNDEKKHWYVLFIFETVDPVTEEEMKNTCDGIDELVYFDLEDATIENSTQGLIDIREAMRNPGKTYI